MFLLKKERRDSTDLPPGTEMRTTRLPLNKSSVVTSFQANEVTSSFGAIRTRPLKDTNGTLSPSFN